MKEKIIEILNNNSQVMTIMDLDDELYNAPVIHVIDFNQIADEINNLCNEEIKRVKIDTYKEAQDSNNNVIEQTKSMDDYEFNIMRRRDDDDEYWRRQEEPVIKHFKD